jgi:lipopolysaccharide/colanic/teichoic acid biosynthesis glycosyltransferase
MKMRKKSAPQDISRCTPSSNNGHCPLVEEKWFARALGLERKRTERSRKPFVLALINLEGIEALNGAKDNYVQRVVSEVTSFARETDITGWYRNGSVLGIIFTELGSSLLCSVSVASIASKLASALERSVGKENSVRIEVSYHTFPEHQTDRNSSGRIDSKLYPDLQDLDNLGWPHSTGKRIIDIALSSIALLILFPLFLLIAAAVKLSSKGPVLFRQERVGLFGNRFTLLKFRTMQTGNASIVHEQYVRKLITGSLGAPDNGVFKIKNDPRMTPIGRLLRKSSLDELPQFWNVLIGEMSLVGPRPPLPYEVDIYDIWHRRRLLEVKPGITGLWQVTGRSRTCFDDMVRLDLRYTRSSSLWLDVRILLKTPQAVLDGDGAY